MGLLTRGFHGRGDSDPSLPPGQYLTHDFPVLSAGATPTVPLDEWSFTVTAEDGAHRTWDWDRLMQLPSEERTVDLHCVTRWSKLATTWRGVSLDLLLEDVATEADYAMVHCYGGYTTNLPLQDLLDGQGWLVHEYEGEPLEPVHGGPARLLVPHLYLWKSAKWANGIQLLLDDEPGFWEGLGYHMYGDPWQEQRYG